MYTNTHKFDPNEGKPCKAYKGYLYSSAVLKGLYQINSSIWSDKCKRRKLQECKSLSILLSYRLSQKPKLLGCGKFNHLNAYFLKYTIQFQRYFKPESISYNLHFPWSYPLLSSFKSEKLHTESGIYSLLI